MKEIIIKFIENKLKQTTGLVEYLCKVQYLCKDKHGTHLLQLEKFKCGFVKKVKNTIKRFKESTTTATDKLTIIKTFNRLFVISEANLFAGSLVVFSIPLGVIL